ncbi:YbaB/EbfC family nucleoid-associated protein [Amycolatopsis sp. NBC_00345]|uniref:YbaB/EbfC family nucleoid-associated protein n=1 Tax=Amycolatopsis sp. NBC_00345 TaxID=2975955 RepID=UPI002E26E4AA
MDGQLRYRELASALREIRDALAEIRSIADSPDGLIRATTDGHGRLLELELDPRIYRTTDSQALTTAITDTVRAAAEAAEAEIARIGGKLLTPSTGV